ncbi:hypothetical protein M0813_12579 [Anaeramoeba flamelloides]|uniref:RGS domain-containing protein n=1 Tax=Anaeramoeba flamelloides TaxID=1746091 RepID=A0ABQ8ZC52_9EUKA|nr:hypothetical protein M0813_12579 [Anaeramoeba flamelloides]
MGNEFSEKNFPKLNTKTFKKQFKTQSTTEQKVFYLDDFGRICKMTNSCCQLFGIESDKSLQGFSLDQFSPIKQPHLLQKSLDLIEIYSEKLISENEKKLNIVWCCLPPNVIYSDMAKYEKNDLKKKKYFKKLMSSSQLNFLAEQKEKQEKIEKEEEKEKTETKTESDTKTETETKTEVETEADTEEETEEKNTETTKEKATETENKRETPNKKTKTKKKKNKKKNKKKKKTKKKKKKKNTEKNKLGVSSPRQRNFQTINPKGKISNITFQRKTLKKLDYLKQYKKLGLPKDALWFAFEIHPLLIEGNLYFQCSMTKMETPISLLNNRVKILSYQKKIKATQRRIEESQKNFENSSINKKSVQVQEELKEKISALNTVRNSHLKNQQEIKEMKETISQRTTETTEKELKPALFQLQKAERKYYLDFNKLKSERQIDTLNKKRQTCKIRVEELKQETRRINQEIEKINKKYDENDRLLREREKTNFDKICTEKKFETQKNIIEDLASSLEFTLANIEKTQSRIKKFKYNKDITIQLAQTRHKLQLMIKSINNLKSRLLKANKKNTVSSPKLHSSFYNYTDSEFSDTLSRISSPSLKQEGKIRRKKSPRQRISKLKIKRPSFSFKNDENILKRVDDQYLPKSPRYNNNQNNFSTQKSIENLFEVSSIEDDETKGSVNKILMRQVSDFSTFDQLMKYSLAIEFFNEFLAERSKQNEFIFYLEIKEFKRCYNNENAEDIISYLINNFIEDNAIFSIELENDIKSDILDQYYENQFTENIFNKIEEIIYKQFCEKYFPEFKKSALFEQFCQIDYAQNQILLKSTLRIGFLTSEQKTNTLLNNFFTNTENIPNPNTLIQELMESLISMLNVNFSITSETINCQKIVQTLSFKRFQNSCSLLNNIPISEIISLDEQSKKAFFLNLFNVISIHSIMINPSPTYKNSLKNFLKNSNYSMGGYVFSLHDIKYGIFELSKTLKASLSNKFIPFYLDYDPRINFALMNFSSHPSKLTTFYPETVEAQLEEITLNYLNQNCIFEKEKKKIFLPIINNDNFYNYGNVKVWIRNYLNVEDPISFYLSKLEQTRFVLQNSINLDFN